MITLGWLYIIVCMFYLTVLGVKQVNKICREFGGYDHEEDFK